MAGVLRQPKGFYKSVFALMVPMILQSLITHTATFADSFMVGMLGEQYLAAISIATAPIFAFSVLNLGVQSGAGVLVAQYWGKGDTDAINRVLGVGLGFSLVFTMSGAAVMASAPYKVLSLFTSDPAIVAVSVSYLRIASIAIVLNAVSMVYISCQRSMENAGLGVVVLIASSCISIFGNWVLITGRYAMPALGIKGAAVSTLCARVAELLIVSVYAIRNSRLPLKIKLLLKPGVIILKDFLKYSLPVLLNEAIWAFGSMLYPVILGHMAGAQSNLAAYNITETIGRMFGAIVLASSNATAVIIGRELGAGRHKQADSAAKSLIVLGLLLALIPGFLIFLARNTILKPFVFPLFDLSSEASVSALTMLAIYAFIIPIRTFGFTMGIGVLRGGGDVRAMMLIDSGTLYAFGLSFAAVTGLVFKLNVEFVYLSMLIDDVMKSFFIFLRYRKKKWIHNATRDQLT